MKKLVTITTLAEVDIPDDKVSEYLDGYKELIDKGGTISDLFEHIAYNVVVNSTTFIDGVGRVKEDGCNFYEDTESVDIDVRIKDHSCDTSDVDE